MDPLHCGVSRRRMRRPRAAAGPPTPPPLSPRLSRSPFARRALLLAAGAVLAAASPTAVLANSDLVQRLYRLEQSGATAGALSVRESALPAGVTSRLSDASLSWGALSGLQQRALLWDSGFVQRADDADALVQVYTACGRTMADLLPDASAVEAAFANATSGACALGSCGAINRFLGRGCDSDVLAPSSAVQCVVEADAMAGAPVVSGGVVWAEDGLGNAVPSPVIRRHSAANASYALYALHMGVTVFTGTSMCQANGEFIVPCRAKGAVSDADLCAASPGATMDAWLAFSAVPAPSSFSTAAIVMLALLLCVCLGLVLAVWYLVRHRKLLRDRLLMEAGADGGPGGALDALLSEPPAARLLSEERLTPMEVFFGARPRSRRTPGVKGAPAGAIVATTRAEISLSNDQLCRKSAVLRRFVAEPTVVTKRISFAQLAFLRLLSKGGMGEVWLGQYEARYVAMKCLLPTKREDVPSLEQFSDEIRMASVLDHPRIVGFVGVAWQSLLHLCAITEFMERGDLEALLALPAAASVLSWPREKISLAIDVADALVYLHSLVPVVIHRDLKSKNVLLDRNLRAKLSDFGLSRERSVEDTMTNGVGTILWSAPEVLEGNQYDEKADIFSFGIVLSEIDTCALPYGFVKDRGGGGGGGVAVPAAAGIGAGIGAVAGIGAAAAGAGGGRNKMKSMQIVHLVSEGKLLPTFRDDCPPALVALAQRCLRLDPAARPTAMEVVYELRASILPLLLQQQTDDAAAVATAATGSASTAVSTPSSDQPAAATSLTDPSPPSAP